MYGKIPNVCMARWCGDPSTKQDRGFLVDQLAGIKVEDVRRQRHVCRIWELCCGTVAVGAAADVAFTGVLGAEGAVCSPPPHFGETYALDLRWVATKGTPVQGLGFSFCSSLLLLLLCVLLLFWFLLLGR